MACIGSEETDAVGGFHWVKDTVLIVDDAAYEAQYVTCDDSYEREAVGERH